VNEKVTVEMDVKSTGGRVACFLNSEGDYKDAKNFTVFIPEEALAKFKAAKIEDPKAHFKGKTVRVVGTMTLYRDKPQIKVDSPDQVTIVEKK
jgi:DNA/RNA endonuclease YhcR with UshA esterase domain